MSCPLYFCTNNSEEIEYCVRYLEAHQSYKRKSYFLELGKGPTKSLPSVLQPPTLELKQLPTHLWYAYLGEQTTLPVIIANDLNEIEENKLSGYFEITNWPLDGLF
ncbi:reverse transcriptase [Abeliophyllum distichum]|uniref:Reverse transcriptase n=1 Tax=Abeliophyllum distichum TaxID=126358 RepID=A0ABD1W0K8_9LAMI